MVAESRATALLVGTTPSQARLIRETLAAATGGPFNVSHASRLGDALALLARGVFDVVLLDSPLPDASPSEALARVVAAARGAGIVLLVRPSSAELARDALAAGAHAFVAKDPVWELDAPRLMRAIHTALSSRKQQVAAAARPADRSRGTMLGFLGAKGGSCTTSVTLRIAGLHSAQGSRTVLAEMRSWPGALASLSGVTGTGHIGQLSDVEPGRLEPQLIDQILTAAGSNLKLLLAPSVDRGGTGLSAEQTVRLLDGLTRIAERVVVDLPCELTPALPVVCRASDFLAVVVETEAAAIRQARRVVELIASWSVGVVRIGALVIYRTPTLVESLARLRSALDCDELATLPVAPGCRLVAVPGEPPDRLVSGETLNLCLEALAGRLDTQDAVPTMIGSRVI